MKITVETRVHAPVDVVWSAWTTPADVEQWNAASDDWHTTGVAMDLRKGGAFSSRMEAKDGSDGFDFAGVFTSVVPRELIEYVLGDDRLVTVEFAAGETGVTVRETFDAESVNDPELQRQGWQAILDNFARYVEAKHGPQSD